MGEDAVNRGPGQSNRSIPHLRKKVDAIPLLSPLLFPPVPIFISSRHSILKPPLQPDLSHPAYRYCQEFCQMAFVEL